MTVGEASNKSNPVIAKKKINGIKPVKCKSSASTDSQRAQTLLNDSYTRASQLEKELSAANTRITDLEALRSAKDREIDKLRDQMVEAMAESNSNRSARQDLARAETELASARSKIASLESGKTGKEMQLNILRELIDKLAHEVNANDHRWSRISKRTKDEQYPFLNDMWVSLKNQIYQLNNTAKASKEKSSYWDLLNQFKQ
ncbi:MAG: hypothetical protein HY692_06130 [Cyanobacteria bacterium NC_groundwater_1444_Ag_S-0.65um_54_12]|nr:hypothetical protein [Cyanobacteria bacterium NC_groundwater_1444_Ag_S-0.65um_54_12]